MSLLRLLLPDKYDAYSVEQFDELVDKQSHIIQKTALILDDLGDYEEEIEDLQQTSFSEESMMETPKRNLMNEYEPSIPPPTNSLNEEEAFRLLEETPGDEVLDDDALMEIVDAETTQKPLFDSHSTENEENIEKLLASLKEGILSAERVMHRGGGPDFDADVTDFADCQTGLMFNYLVGECRRFQFH